VGATAADDQVPDEDLVVAGLDLSLTGTGIATATGLRLVASDGQEHDPLGARRRRLAELVAEITGALAAADLVFIEGPSLGQKTQRGTFDRAGLWWLVVDQLAHDAVAVAEVPPKTLKLYATGNGQCTKPDIRVETLKRYGIDIRDDNEGDAFVLRAIGLDLLGRPLVKLPESHRRALKALDGWRAGAT
jgi:crossover junction endodeoxyribonuclease RuvC